MYYSISRRQKSVRRYTTSFRYNRFSGHFEPLPTYSARHYTTQTQPDRVEGHNESLLSGHKRKRIRSPIVALKRTKARKPLTSMNVESSTGPFEYDYDGSSDGSVYEDCLSTLDEDEFRPCLQQDDLSDVDEHSSDTTYQLLSYIGEDPENVPLVGRIRNGDGSVIHCLPWYDNAELYTADYANIEDTRALTDIPPPNNEFEIDNKDTALPVPCRLCWHTNTELGANIVGTMQLSTTAPPSRLPWYTNMELGNDDDAGAVQPPTMVPPYRLPWYTSMESDAVNDSGTIQLSTLDPSLKPSPRQLTFNGTYPPSRNGELLDLTRDMISIQESRYQSMISQLRHQADMFQKETGALLHLKKLIVDEREDTGSNNELGIVNTLDHELVRLTKFQEILQIAIDVAMLLTVPVLPN